MERKPTTDELRAFHGYTKRTKKSPVVECQLIDHNGYIHARGNYALCVAIRSRMNGSNMTIKVIRQTDIKPDIYTPRP
jgi:hypothetical protein